MKSKKFLKILIIVIILIILIVTGVICLNNNKSKSNDRNFDVSKMNDMQKDSKMNQSENKTMITGTGEVSSALIENLELHATYYLEECYVQTNQLVKSGENILKYTNGTYLVAPYDCVITEINIPESGEKCTNEHYVKVASNNTLSVQFKVDETKVSSISLGQSASVSFSAFEDKSLEAVVTNVSSTASNGKFTVTVEFDNDGDVMLGMTAEVCLEV